MAPARIAPTAERGGGAGPGGRIVSKGRLSTLSGACTRRGCAAEPASRQSGGRAFHCRVASISDCCAPPARRIGLALHRPGVHILAGRLRCGTRQRESAAIPRRSNRVALEGPRLGVGDSDCVGSPGKALHVAARGLVADHTPIPGLCGYSSHRRSGNHRRLGRDRLRRLRELSAHAARRSIDRRGRGCSVVAALMVFGPRRGRPSRRVARCDGAVRSGLETLTPPRRRPARIRTDRNWDADRVPGRVGALSLIAFHSDRVALAWSVVALVPPDGGWTDSRARGTPPYLGERPRSRRRTRAGSGAVRSTFCSQAGTWTLAHAAPRSGWTERATALTRPTPEPRTTAR